MGLLYLMRCFTMFVTVLPVASYTYYCSPKFNGTTVLKVLEAAFKVSSGFGLSIAGEHTYCGDYIYSGHTVILVTAFLVIQECELSINLTFEFCSDPDHYRNCVFHDRCSGSQLAMENDSLVLLVPECCGNLPCSYCQGSLYDRCPSRLLRHHKSVLDLPYSSQQCYYESKRVVEI